MFESGHQDLLQLAVSIGLERHPGESLGSQDDRGKSSLIALIALVESHHLVLKPDFQVPYNKLQISGWNYHCSASSSSLLTMASGILLGISSQLLFI